MPYGAVYTSNAPVGPGIGMSQNGVYSGTGTTGWVYQNSGYASSYSQFFGNHIWWIASSGTATASTLTYVAAMTLNTSGQLIVSSTATSRSNTLGALVVTGGVGIGGNLYVGGGVAVDTTATIVNIISTSSTGTTNALAYGNTLLASYNSGVLTTTTAVILDSFSTSTYRSAKYFCQATSGTYIHISEISVFHSAGSSYINEYGISVNNSTLGIYDANILNGNLNILFTPSTNTATTVKLSRFTMTI
jgi:hypothetical protein